MSKHLKHRLLLLVTITAVCVVPIKLVLNWMNQPSSVAVHITSAATKAAIVPPLAMQSSLFDTTAPSGFKSRPAPSPATAAVPVHLLAIDGSTDQQISLIGGTTPSEGLEAVADYNLRVKEAADYQRLTDVDLPAGAVAFAASTGSPSYTVFWAHAGHYAEISVSADAANMADLHKTLLFLLQNWQWR